MTLTATNSDQHIQEQHNANPSSACENNSLVRPLLNFNGLFVSAFKPLDTSSCLCDLIKRIAIIMIAPLAYLTTAILALIGAPFNCCFKHRVDPALPEQVPSQPQGQPSDIEEHNAGAAMPSATTPDDRRSVVSSAKELMMQSTLTRLPEQAPSQPQGQPSNIEEYNVSAAMPSATTAPDDRRSIVSRAKVVMMQSMLSRLPEHHHLQSAKIFMKAQVGETVHFFHFVIRNENGPFFSPQSLEEQIDTILQTLQDHFSEIQDSAQSSEKIIVWEMLLKDDELNHTPQWKIEQFGPGLLYLNGSVFQAPPLMPNDRRNPDSSFIGTCSARFNRASLQNKLNQMFNNLRLTREQPLLSEHIDDHFEFIDPSRQFIS